MARAATPVTVAQAEEFLRSAHSLPDSKAAEKLASLEMVERVSSARLARWQADFPGPHTREVLLALADASAFLDLPASEIPDLKKPDPAARRDLLLRAVGYVNTTLHRLPNFSAVRTTTHFDNVPPDQRKFNKFLPERMDRNLETSIPNTPAPHPEPLRDGDTSSVIVTYRDGREVVDARAGGSAKPATQQSGLTTSGEFGPILSVVMGDAIRGEMFWDHWEQGINGPMAVFRYAVPARGSHYTVIAADGKPRLPAYHGQIAVEPATGTVLRLTVVSDFDPAERTETAILVEYAPVVIGSSSYTCPVKGVAFSRVPNFAAEDYFNVTNGKSKGAQPIIPPETFVNDISFTGYHLFKADLRIVP